MKTPTYLLLLFATVSMYGQGNKVYSEAGSDEELKAQKQQLVNQKAQMEAHLQDFIAARNLEQEYYAHRNNAFNYKDEKELEVAYSKLKEARELMGSAHTKWKAYQNSLGNEIISVYEAEYTDVIKRYDQWLSPGSMAEDRNALKPVTEIYLVAPENTVQTTEALPKKDLFWETGTDSNENPFVFSIGGKRINFKNYEFQFLERFIMNTYRNYQGNIAERTGPTLILGFAKKGTMESGLINLYQNMQPRFTGKSDCKRCCVDELKQVHNLNEYIVFAEATQSQCNFDYYYWDERVYPQDLGSYIRREKLSVAISGKGGLMNILFNFKDLSLEDSRIQKEHEKIMELLKRHNYITPFMKNDINYFRLNSMDEVAEELAYTIQTWIYAEIYSQN